ncbi:MAG TPA: molybdopterin cofactor-binding domain-containing protein [Blastocatellia bacterium]|nr:molybdopterin cofactor-binding domain-containing protein [Blastocatellia bacterium]
MMTRTLMPEAVADPTSVEDVFAITGFDETVKRRGMSRRSFLKGTGMLVVSFSLGRAMKLAEWGEEALAQVPSNQVDSFIAIAADGSVTAFTGKVDLGTGISVGLRQMLAEELDVAYERIRWIQGDTAVVPDQGATVGSRSISDGGATIRRAGAAARQFLLNLASERLGVPVDQLVVNDGVVSVKSDSSRKVTYGELIGDRKFGLTVPAAGQIQLKTPDQFRVIGKPIPRGDIAERIFGVPFVQNVRVPGMVHARVVHPPASNAKLLSVDESAVRQVPGFIALVVKGDFVGVVCEREEQAIKAAKVLKEACRWSTPDPSFPPMTDLYTWMKQADAAPSNIIPPVGDVDAALASAPRVFSQTYYWPFQMHGAMTPMCSVADVKGDKVTIWSGTQYPHGTRTPVANYLGIPVENVRVIYAETSGVYGRAVTDDSVLEAVILSQAVGRPVRLQWMREDEHGWEPKGPAHVMTVRAGTDAAGTIIAWEFEDRTFPWTMSEPLAARLMGSTRPDGTFNNGSGCAGQEYAFPNKRIIRRNLSFAALAKFQQNTTLRTTALRAPGDPARAFACESFIDELAAAVQADPIEYRLRHLNPSDAVQSRVIDVIKAAAERSGWQPGPSPRPGVPRTGVVTGRGFAFARRGTYVAAVADVEVDQDTGGVRVTRIVIAHDCGLIINPDSVVQQIEGQVIQTVGRALREEVVFDQYRVTSLDWITYPVTRFPDVPQVDIVLINRPDQSPMGVGEPALNPVPAAIANAIFNATGARLRQVPFTPDRVKAALDARR